MSEIVRIDGRTRQTMLGVNVVLPVGVVVGCGGGSPSSARGDTRPTAGPVAAATSVGRIEPELVRIERPAGTTHATGSDVGLYYLTIVNRRPAGDRLSAVTTPDGARVVMRTVPSGAQFSAGEAVVVQEVFGDVPGHKDGAHPAATHITRRRS